MENSSTPAKAFSIMFFGPMLVSSVLALFGVLGIMVFIAPKLQSAVSEFDLKLTPMQSTFFAISDAIRGTSGRTGYWVFIAPAIVVVAIVLGVLFLKSTTRAVGRLLLFLTFLVAMTLVVATVYSCYSPLISLMENLATNAKGAI